MPRNKILFVVLNVLGGVAVLASYALGLNGPGESAGSIWGGVPESLRPLYTVNMLLAAAGYFAFTPYLLLRADAQSARFLGRFGFGWVNALYAAILFPSALWLPLTNQMLATPSSALWWAIRVDLALVGLASLALLASVVSVRPRPAPIWHALAVVGLLAFCLQTALLDALVWPWYFPVG